MPFVTKQKLFSNLPLNEIRRINSYTQTERQQFSNKSYFKVYNSLECNNFNSYFTCLENTLNHKIKKTFPGHCLSYQYLINWYIFDKMNTIANIIITNRYEFIKSIEIHKYLTMKEIFLPNGWREILDLIKLRGLYIYPESEKSYTDYKNLYNNILDVEINSFTSAIINSRPSNYNDIKNLFLERLVVKIGDNLSYFKFPDEKIKTIEEYVTPLLVIEKDNIIETNMIEIISNDYKRRGFLNFDIDNVNNYYTVLNEEKGYLFDLLEYIVNKEGSVLCSFFNNIFYNNSNNPYTEFKYKNTDDRCINYFISSYDRSVPVVISKNDDKYFVKGLNFEAYVSKNYLEENLFSILVKTKYVDLF